MLDSGVVGDIAHLTILCLAILESAILAIDGPQVKNSTTLGFSVHVEDADDEKHVFQLKPNHSECCWTSILGYFVCHNRPGTHVSESLLDNERDLALFVVPDFLSCDVGFL